VVSFMRAYGRLIDAIGFVLKTIGYLAITSIVCAITLQVVSRYAFGRHHQWVEEFATYCFIWLVFIGAAYAAIKRRHIVVTSLTDLFPPAARKLFRIGAYVVVLAFLYNLVKFGLRQFGVEAPQHTIALPVRLPRRIFYSLPLIIAGISMFLTFAYQLLEELFPDHGTKDAL
jgi:TRAP-type C4-dicarboxylate transport system permease small subunit